MLGLHCCTPAFSSSGKQGLLFVTVHGILQARILEWVVFPFSRGSSQPRNQTGLSYIAGRFFTNWAIREAYLKYKKMKVKVKLLSHVWLFATPWTVALKASLSMGFPRQENQSELPFPSPGESSQPRDAIHVCCIGRRNLYHWGTREALAID